jgi:hypothetical protein
MQLSEVLCCSLAAAVIQWWWCCSTAAASLGVCFLLVVQVAVTMQLYEMLCCSLAAAVYSVAVLMKRSCCILSALSLQQASQYCYVDGTERVGLSSRLGNDILTLSINLLADELL